jgi:hypothetical protein
MRDRPLHWSLRVLDLNPAVWGGDEACITDLSTRLRVKRCALKKDLYAFVLGRGIN